MNGLTLWWEKIVNTCVNNVFNIFILPSHVSMQSIIVLLFSSSKYVRIANHFVGRRSRDLITVLMVDCLVHFKGWASIE